MAVLHKKLFRALMRSWAESLAVIMVVLCGTASYICLHSCYLNLSLTRDTYYTQNRLADFEIMLERAPANAIFKVEEIPGVRQARARMVKDVNVDIEGVDEPRVGRIISMPVPRQHVLNDVVVMEGQYFGPGAQDEVIISDSFARLNNLAIGDRLSISVEEKKYSLRIIGYGLSPEYVYMIRTLQEMVPAPERFGILWVPEDFAETALDMKEACNNILGEVDDPEALDAILDRADDLLDGYGVFAKVKQEDQISVRFLGDEIQGLGVNAKITPTLFLGIAALILFVLLSRMVRMERTQIGLMKAYGYTNFSVAFHYLQYGIILSGAGCIGGFALGQWMANGLIKLYVQFYQFPILESRVYPDVLSKSMGIALGFGALGALFAAIRAARIRPAESMRPEAPPLGHRVWVERVGMLWQNLSFTWKMIVRNLARNRFRAGLNVFGVAISTGLVIMGFFSLSGMEFWLRFQFQEVQREDVKISFQGERGKRTYYEMARFDHVRRVEPILEYPFTLSSDWRKKDTIVVGLPEGAELQKLMTFKGKEVPVGETGVVLSDRLARVLGVGVGDRVRMKPLMGRVEGEKTAVVRDVAQQFMGTNAYMDIEALSRLLEESFAMNAALLRIDEGAEESINKDMKDVAGVASVVFSSEAYDSLMETLAGSSRIMNVVVLLFAGVISFSIIYNVTSVALAERQRELASLRVLGLTTAEVGRILYHENILLGLIGATIGLPFGAGICWLLVKAYDTDLYRMPFHIEQDAYVKAVLLTLLFVLLANLAVRRKIHRLDLVEVLKERE